MICGAWSDNQTNPTNEKVVRLYWYLHLFFTPQSALAFTEEAREIWGLRAEDMGYFTGI